MNMIITQQHKNFQFGNLNLRKITLKFCLMAAGFGSLSAAHGQTSNVLAEADSYFTAGEYYTAAVLYGQYLRPAVKAKSYGDFPLYNKKGGSTTQGYHSLNDVAYKQAESYRLSHYWQEAADLYKSCYGKDSVKYAGSLFWYAVCQRSLGNFELANKSLQQFLSQSPQDNAYRKDAEREIETLRFIQNQLQRPDTALFHLQKLSGTDLPEKGLYAPIIGRENQVFFTSTQTDSLSRPGVSPYHNRLFSASVQNGSIENIIPVSFDGLDGSLNQGTASVSADGNYIYFTQWKNENGKSTSSIYYSQKNGSSWSQPLSLNSVNLAGYNSKQPFCTPDGKYLYFSTDREGGQGGFDIWYAPLHADGTTGSPVNAGATINTDGNEQAPFVHSATNTLVFSSDKLPGMGGYDLFMAQGNEGKWQSPVNMGYPVNSNRDDIYFFTAGKASLLENALFSSDRGNSCCLSTFTVTKTPKNRVLTGLVLDCESNQPLTGAEVVMKDANGKELHMQTNEEGRYQFDLTGVGNTGQFLVSKEKYKDTTTGLQVEKTIESNWKTDTVYNAPICVAEKKLVIKVENVVSLYFSFDRSRLKERSIVQLDSIYNVLVENPRATIQISGYTDGIGSTEYNKKLSDKRAKACADYLIAKGIEPARITFESFGACCPVEMEKINGRDNPSGRRMNRRALINISKE
jgi:outer membrane protein OmpA-like peptidoglycan-associated protein/tetratricopeptide (TPR) repeat protein